MRNIKITLAYDGTGYAGWQRQKGQPTIQQTIEEKIEVMTGRAVVLNGAGRTDAGVHALAMTANFRTEAMIPEEGLRAGLNSLLPEDIRILQVAEMHPDFHARFDAVGKCYHYFFSTGGLQLPTERLYTYHLHDVLDRGAMQRCLDLLVGQHDFSSFEAAGSRDRHHKEGKGAIRRIFWAGIKDDGHSPPRYCLDIAGNGFLRHMVRNIAGTLFEVGRNKRSEADFSAAFGARDRAAAGPTAPARGLFLKEVFYETAAVSTLL